MQQKKQNSTIIDNSPGRKLMRLFNAIPGEIRDITGQKTEAFLKKRTGQMVEQGTRQTRERRIQNMDR